MGLGFLLGLGFAVEVCLVVDLGFYGAATQTGGSSTGATYQESPYTFGGGILDRATGHVKFGGRWYDPTAGTWTQQDTLNAPLDPTNRYTYVGGDSINRSDPTGQFCSGVFNRAGDGAIIGALVGGIGGALAGGLFTGGIGAVPGFFLGGGEGGVAGTFVGAIVGVG